MPEIILEHITKRWGDFVGVDDLDLVIEDHAFVTLLGPSGCGKTTTLRMIAGLETPTSGRITIGDKVVFDSEKHINIPPNKRNVGFLFQNYALWPHMTVYKNIAFGLENLKWPKDKIKARVNELLKLLKIEEFVERYPSELSGGQQQRVAIARTLAPNPSVLFMDEPLSNLDAKLRLEMRTELKRLHLETNSTFVYVTHDQLEAMTLATQVCLMEKGLLQQYDPPLTVYAKPNNLFVADFVGNPTMNFIDAVARQNSAGEIEVEFAGTKAIFDSNDKNISFDMIRAEAEKTLLDQKEKEEESIDKKLKEALKAKKKTKKKDSEEEEIPLTKEELLAEIEDKYAEKLEEVRAAKSLDIILGVRPEYVKIGEKKGISGSIYSSLPAGMETTVKVKLDEETIITSVVFGIIDFPVNSETKFNITGDKIVIFEKLSRNRITDGVVRLAGAKKPTEIE